MKSHHHSRPKKMKRVQHRRKRPASTQKVANSSIPGLIVDPERIFSFLVSIIVVVGVLWVITEGIAQWRSHWLSKYIKEATDIPEAAKDREKSYITEADATRAFNLWFFGPQRKIHRVIYNLTPSSHQSQLTALAMYGDPYIESMYKELEDSWKFVLDEVTANPSYTRIRYYNLSRPAVILIHRCHRVAWLFRKIAESPGRRLATVIDNQKHLFNYTEKMCKKADTPIPDVLGAVREYRQTYIAQARQQARCLHTHCKYLHQFVTRKIAGQSEPEALPDVLNADCGMD